jgi:hypothetical protein
MHTLGGQAALPADMDGRQPDRSGDRDLPEDYSESAGSRFSIVSSREFDRFKVSFRTTRKFFNFSAPC